MTFCILERQFCIFTASVKIALPMTTEATHKFKLVHFLATGIRCLQIIFCDILLNLYKQRCTLQPNFFLPSLCWKDQLLLFSGIISVIDPRILKGKSSEINAKQKVSVNSQNCLRYSNPKLDIPISEKFWRDRFDRRSRNQGESSESRCSSSNHWYEFRYFFDFGRPRFHTGC